MSEQLGIACPNCGCLESTKVQRTVANTDCKKRYRKCFKCGSNFVTQELVQEKTEKTKKKKY